MLLTLIGTIAALISLLPITQQSSRNDLGNLYFAALNELLGNADALDRCVPAKKCVGVQLEAESLRLLTDEHFDDLAKWSYGEEAHLSEIVRRQVATKMGSILESEEVARLRFEAMFLAWYLMPHAMSHLSPLQKSSFIWRLPLKDCGQEYGFVVIAGAKVRCFSQYLGYLD